MEKKSPKSYEACLKAVEAIAQEYKVQFEFSYRVSATTVSKLSGKWQVRTMGKSFVHRDFIEASKEAMIIVLQAFGQTDLANQLKEKPAKPLNPMTNNQPAEAWKAGDCWLAYIKQFPKLDEFWNTMPEPINIWLRQQIDIYAGKYPQPTTDAAWKEALESEAETRYPVATHATPALSPYKTAQWGFKYGAEWARSYLTAPDGAEAVAFAEWIVAHNYTFALGKYWVKWLNGLVTDGYHYTTQQLYEAFLHTRNTTEEK